uniref:Uncharacterized protein n=1 Tax=Arundo donax TaxID=35708 RepID=A0A0A9H2N3_ARUDO
MASTAPRLPTSSSPTFTASWCASSAGSSMKRPTRTPSDCGSSWRTVTTRTASSTSRAPAGSRYRSTGSKSGGIPCGPKRRVLATVKAAGSVVLGG